MSYGTVTGKFLSPEGEPLVGTVEFTPEVSAVLLGGVDPATVFPVGGRGELDEGGVLSDNGTPGVELVAPEEGVTNPTGWTYRVYPRLRTKDGRDAKAPVWSIEVTPGGTVDLTTTAPVPSSSGVGVTRGLSNYELWLGEGNTGTVDDYLSSLTGDLTGYATTAQVTAALSTKADVEDIPAPPDLSGYATLGDIPDVTGFALASDIPDVSGFATLEDIPPPPDLSPYARLTDIPAPVDLTGYATQAYVNQATATKDTGWRNVRATMVGVNTGGTARVRRVGNTVTLDLVSISFAAAGAVDITPAGWLGASGFTPMLPIRDILVMSQTGNPLKEYILFETTRIRAYAVTAGETFNKSIIWTTLDPWPSTLPGSAA